MASNRFSVDSSLNLMKRFLKNPGTPGAAHCDELSYLFRYPRISLKQDELYRYLFRRCSIFQPFYDEVLNNKDSAQSKISLQTIEYVTKLFTNFANYGYVYRNDKVVNDLV